MCKTKQEPLPESSILALIQLARNYFISSPQHFITQLEYGDRYFWVKRRPHEKKRFWHVMQSALTFLVRLPILRSTVSKGGAQSLNQEAAQLRLFASKSIPVPEVIAVNDEFIITSDVGLQLQGYLSQLDNDARKSELLCAAAHSLARLHQAGLCHGRPSLRDMTLAEETIYFIDLEEEPLAVMSLAQAQARDIWLFLNNVARYTSKKDDLLLRNVFAILNMTLTAETRAALRQMVMFLRPFRVVVERMILPLTGGRDVRCAVKANKVLEQSL
ncbi:hypothetical protein ACFORL_04575 [Legionella dresdenensis]|uniref:Serine/threonine protein kinase n=1 Tax=Legionella dresdenensis TaxID=450200 RepID=A0ABV8CEE1_9GAMM